MKSLQVPAPIGCKASISSFETSSGASSASNPPTSRAASPTGEHSSCTHPGDVLTKFFPKPTGEVEAAVCLAKPFVRRSEVKSTSAEVEMKKKILEELFKKEVLGNNAKPVLGDDGEVKLEWHQIAGSKAFVKEMNKERFFKNVG